MRGRRTISNVDLTGRIHVVSEEIAKFALGEHFALK
jgi:hypothetical protein